MQATPATGDQVTQDAEQTGASDPSSAKRSGATVALVGFIISFFVLFKGLVLLGIILLVVSLVIGIAIQRG